MSAPLELDAVAPSTAATLAPERTAMPALRAQPPASRPDAATPSPDARSQPASPTQPAPSSRATPPHSPRDAAAPRPITPAADRKPERQPMRTEVVVERAESALVPGATESLPLMTKLVGTKSSEPLPASVRLRGEPDAPSAEAARTAPTEPTEVVARREPTRERASRAPAALPRMDLQQALGSVARALSQPPRPRAAAADVVTHGGEEVQITIGHIDVRANPPAAPASPPARRGPSITLADYLRRRPGSAR